MPSSTTKPRRRQQSTAAGSSQDRHRSCHFCNEKIQEVDFRNVASLRRMMSDRGGIRSRRVTGNCRRHQSQVEVAVKRAREMALLPYVNS
jgi:small subunit ribosomal protein S18